MHTLRLLDLVVRLEQEEILDADKLARDWNVSVRTVYRDMQKAKLLRQLMVKSNLEVRRKR